MSAAGAHATICCWSKSARLVSIQPPSSCRRRLLIVSETGSFEEALLERYSEAGFDWTYVSPAALPGHDPREDDIVAIAVLDELEAPRHFRQRLTVAS